MLWAFLAAFGCRNLLSPGFVTSTVALLFLCSNEADGTVWFALKRAWNTEGRANSGSPIC
jgi:UPF0716 family protein affecting phage T7 exclusion